MNQDTIFPAPQTTMRPILTTKIANSLAWKRADLAPADWLVPLPPPCVAELDAVVDTLRQNPQPVERLTATTFTLPACSAVMARVGDRLRHRRGFAIVDGIPVERYSETEGIAIGWLLSQLLGQVVEQKWDGTRLYNVRDYGKTLGYGVRRSVTNLEQDFHTDGGWLSKTPETIGLFCLQPAREGGMSRVVSLLTVHNELQRQHPELLARLYQPFWWDRQAEHAPEEAKYCPHPVYEYDGQSLSGRYYEDYVINGYKLAGAPMDQAGLDALAAMRAIADEPENWLEFRVDKGQFQCVNNRQVAHSRTAFVDAPETHLRRHLLRLWNRNDGPPDLEAQGRRSGQ
jgi:alpha-ketoglutarate-dependent taurine dioxygenase